jgi:thiol:disulfide interchange protein DsbC
MKKIFVVLFLVTLAAPGYAFMKGGCGAGQCKDCHSLEKEEASTLLKGGVDRVLSVDFAEIPGLWVVEVEKNNQKFPVYIDFSKSYVVSGNIIRLKDHQNVTSERQARISQVDVSKIPLDDALLLGKPGAKTKVIVFTDPECPYCKRLHAELKEVVQRDPDIAFLIKMFPLKIHPNSYSVAQTIVCTKSLSILEDSYNGKMVPPPLCQTKVVDANIALAHELGINSTPTLILPDGTISPGFKTADVLLNLIAPDTAGTPLTKSAGR